MTINTFVLKGDLNGKIVVVCFFLCWVYFAHDIKPFKKCASLVFIPCCDLILHDIFWQFVENWHLFLDKP